jgi:hypothetical protein
MSSESHYSEMMYIVSYNSHNFKSVCKAPDGRNTRASINFENMVGI